MLELLEVAAKDEIAMIFSMERFVCSAGPCWEYRRDVCIYACR